MLRSFQGIVLGLIAQGATHLLLTWPLQAHILPPNAWHLLAFVVGGLVCGAYARSPVPGVFVAFPYAALVLWGDFLIGPGVSAAAVLYALAGIILGTTICGLLARRRRLAERASAAMAAPEPPAPDPGA